MGKMFEALQKVEREKTKELEPDVSEPILDQMVLDEKMVTYFMPESVASEQFKKLRTYLFKESIHSKELPRTILVTSTTSGEGKTFVAINLAITLATDLQKHALLVDCDLRNPSFSQWFGLSGRKGLSNYLQGENDIQELLIKTNVDKLTLFLGGPANQDNPVELIGSKRMESLVGELNTRYPDRYIIIDSPPLLATTEATVLMKMVDAIVFVVRAGQTSRDSILQAIKNVDKKKIIGVVLNDIEFKTSSLNSRYFGSRDGYYGYYSKMRKPQPKSWKKWVTVPRFFKKKSFRPGDNVK
jgi:protein-tyrosine kinase